MADLKLLSTMGVSGVMRAFGPQFEQEHGVRLAASFMPTVQLLERIRAGEHGDVAILTAEGARALTTEGVLQGPTDLARSFVGVAVRAGAPHPDISSPEAFIATLLRARSVAMSQAGASGLFMADLLERLGIAEQMRAKSIILPSGYTAELAASGAAEIAIQQVSELMVVPGAELVGRLPTELGGETVFAAGLFRRARDNETARALIAAMANPAREALYRSCGLEPTGTAAPFQA